MVLLLLLACGGDETAESGCASFPGEASAVSRPLSNSADCGHWALTVGEHIYVNVSTTEADAPCAGTVEGAVTLAYDPIYSNISGEGPKWTFDVKGVEAGEGSLDVACDEGTTWQARFTVSD